MRNDRSDTTICLERKKQPAKGGKRLRRDAVPERPERREAHRLRQETEARPMVQAAIPAWAEEEQPQQDTVSAHTGNPLKRWRESEGSVSPAITLWEILSTEFRRARRRWRHIVREKKAKRFPESDRLPVQLMLFIWSLVPMAAGRLGEWTLARRKQTAWTAEPDRPLDGASPSASGCFFGTGLLSGGGGSVLFFLHLRYHGNL